MPLYKKHLKHGVSKVTPKHLNMIYPFPKTSDNLIVIFHEQGLKWVRVSPGK